MNTNKILKYSILTGIFVIPFLCFIVSPSMLFPFITGKNFTFRIIVEVIFVLWAILALRDNSFAPKKSWIFYMMGIFIIAMGIADIFGANPYRAFWSNYERMEGFIGLLHLFLYFVVVSTVLRGRTIWDWFLGTWLISSVIMGIYGLLQLSGHITINQSGVRLDGTFGNATYLAVYMMFVFSFTCFLALRLVPKNKSWLWVLVPVGVLELIILYYTATRGNILGLLGGIVVAAVLMAFHERKHPVVKKASIGIIVLLIVLTGVFVAVRNTKFVQNSQVLQRFASLSISDIQTQGRYYIWPMALKGTLERPLTGWGQNNFTYVFSKFYNPAMYSQEQWFDRAHNMFLDWLVAGGLITFIPYLALFVLFFWYLWRRKNNFSNAEKSVLTGLMAAYIFQGLFVFDNLVSYILFFSLLAFVLAESDAPLLQAPAWLTKDAVQNITIAVLVIAGVFVLYDWNIRPIEASQDLIAAMREVQSSNFTASLDDFDKVFALNTFGNTEAREQLVSAASNFLASGVPQDTQTRYVTLAKAQMQAQVAFDPKDARSHVFDGTFLQSIGDNADALTEFQKAEALSPTKQSILYEVGGVQIGEQDYKDALVTFKQAYMLDTDDQDAKTLYGYAALYAGDNATATSILASVDQNALLFDDRFVAVLATTNHYQELVALFEKRLSTPQGQQNAQNYIYLAIAEVQIGEKSQAIALLKQLEQSDTQYKDQIEAYIKQIGG